uniref:hypothetical protein n=1 Tax=Cellvibrio fontiphilus TaxID=1815559 RepID=UPI002B4BCAC8|nr:hypothetical protein [Cellvibrio fontiphilus]
MTILEIHESLKEDTVLYRTLDFYGAANIIKDRKFMFCRADQFQDRNEGIDRLLAQLEAARPNSGCGYGWKDKETAKKEHERVKLSHYISCWSTNAESVAMWSLYSTDLCSVRVSTTVGKLRSAVENLIQKYNIDRFTQDDIGKPITIACNARIAPVVYASLHKISALVARRSKAAKIAYERYEKKNGCPPPIFHESTTNYWNRENQREFKELRMTCNLKDRSFEHEAEVRVAVRLGREPLRKRFIDEIECMNPEHEFHKPFLRTLSYFSLLNEKCTPEREFVDCHDNFIDSVAIDPRCPNHKANFMIDWFKSHNIKIVESTCFGYLPDTFESYPEG